jgi:transposase
MEMESGVVIGKCMRRHRHQERIKFPALIDESADASKAIHIIRDNYATHKHPKIHAWLTKRPPFHVHFTPTGNSSLNLIER